MRTLRSARRLAQRVRTTYAEVSTPATQACKIILPVPPSTYATTVLAACTLEKQNISRAGTLGPRHSFSCLLNYLEETHTGFETYADGPKGDLNANSLTSGNLSGILPNCVTGDRGGYGGDSHPRRDPSRQRCSRTGDSLIGLYTARQCRDPSHHPLRSFPFVGFLAFRISGMSAKGCSVRSM